MSVTTATGEKFQEAKLDFCYLEHNMLCSSFGWIWGVKSKKLLNEKYLFFNQVYPPIARLADAEKAEEIILHFNSYQHSN